MSSSYLSARDTRHSGWQYRASPHKPCQQIPMTKQLQTKQSKSFFPFFLLSYSSFPSLFRPSLDLTFPVVLVPRYAEWISITSLGAPQFSGDEKGSAETLTTSCRPSPFQTGFQIFRGTRIPCGLRLAGSPSPGIDDFPNRVDHGRQRGLNLRRKFKAEVNDLRFNPQD